MILDQVESCRRDCYENSSLQTVDTEMTGVCGELKRRGHHLDPVPEVGPPAAPGSQGQVPLQHPSPPARDVNNAGRPGTNTTKTGARLRATMKLELSVGHHHGGGCVSRPGRALKQRPLALFKARMAQVQQSRSPNRTTPCTKSPGSTSGQ